MWQKFVSQSVCIWVGQQGCTCPVCVRMSNSCCHVLLTSCRERQLLVQEGRVWLETEVKVHIDYTVKECVGARVLVRSVAMDQIRSVGSSRDKLALVFHVSINLWRDSCRGITVCTLIGGEMCASGARVFCSVWFFLLSSPWWSPRWNQPGRSPVLQGLDHLKTAQNKWFCRAKHTIKNMLRYVTPSKKRLCINTKDLCAHLN